MPKSIFVSKLASYTKRSDLHRIFSRYGAITDIYLPRDYYTHELRGFGYIEFERTRDAERVMDSQNHIKLDGHRLQVQWAIGERKTPSEMRRNNRPHRDTYSPHGHRHARRSRSPSLPPRNKPRSRSRSHS